MISAERLADGREQPKTAHDGLKQRQADRTTDVRKALKKAWHVGEIDRKVIQDFYQQKSSLTSAAGTRRGGKRMEALIEKAKSMDPTNTQMILMPVLNGFARNLQCATQRSTGQ